MVIALNASVDTAFLLTLKTSVYYRRLPLVSSVMTYHLFQVPCLVDIVKKGG